MLRMLTLFELQLVNCFSDKNECELLVWNPEVSAKTETQAETEEKTEAEVEERFKTCKKRYETECPGASQDVLFDEYCKITETEFVKLLTNPPKDLTLPHVPRIRNRYPVQSKHLINGYSFCFQLVLLT
uniref:Putative secreted protein n=1 Tax=Amblyomma triste TaxID=251400 RepID=A0A023G2A8_AMBTT